MKINSRNKISFSTFNRYPFDLAYIQRLKIDMKFFVDKFDLFSRLNQLHITWLQLLTQRREKVIPLAFPDTLKTICFDNVDYYLKCF